MGNDWELGTISTSKRLPRLGVAAVIKNELDALQEWIAFHLAVGVEHFIIADIGSRDGSYAYLRELKRLGLVTLVRPSGADEASTDPYIYHSLLAACPTTLDIVAFIDADEFLLPLDEDNEKNNSEASDLTRPEECIEECSVDCSTNVLQPNGLRTWLGDIFSDPDVSALALNSACFGSSGEHFRGDGLVIERFTQRSSRTFRYNRFYKSVVRPSRVRHFDNERHAVLKTGHYVNSWGAPLQMVEERPGVSRRVCWKGARINHYAVKSVEEFVLGQVLNCTGNAETAAQGEAYFSRFDRNARECTIAQTWAGRVYQQLLSLPVASAFAIPFNAPRPSLWRKTRNAALSWWQRARYARLQSQVTPLEAPIMAWKRTWPQQSKVIFTQRGVLLQASVSVASEDIDNQTVPNEGVKLACSWQAGVECLFPATWVESGGKGNNGERGQSYHFRIELPVRPGTVPLTVALSAALSATPSSQRFPLEHLTLLPDASSQEGQASVLIGQQGWLFLDQDTNASLYQHLGYLSLGQEAIDTWVTYAEQLITLTGQKNANVLMVMAPSKERVMHAYHPYPMGAVTPVDQVVEALPDAFCLYPDALLKQMGDDAYHVTDTHWTQQGAMRVTCEALSRLGLTALEDAERWFAEDEYRVVRVRGDLGSKLNPVRMAATQRLSAFDHRDLKRYDNGLPNFGRVIVWENSDAFLDQCCLVMGASSSYMMFPFLVRVFRRVVFVHSAGNIDASLVHAVAAETVLVQTNARFMVRAPQLTWSLHDTILEKTQGVSMEEHAAAFAQRIPAEQAALAGWGLAAWNDSLPEGWFSA